MENKNLNLMNEEIEVMEDEIIMCECDLCGDIHPEEDVKIMFNQSGHELIVCEECEDNYGRYCEYHNRYEVDSTSYEDGFRYIECYGEICDLAYDWGEFTYCNDCDRYFHTDDMYYSDSEDEYFCGDCIEYHTTEGHITDYHDHDYDYDRLTTDADDDIDDDEDNLTYFGVELEVERGNSSICRGEMSEILYDMDFEDVLVYENDGSLNDGFEIITKPMTFNYVKENKNFFKDFINKLENNKYKSYSTSSCGMHIHISNKFNVEEEKLFIAVHEFFKEEFTVLSRREERNLNRWSKFRTKEYTKEELNSPEVFEDILMNECYNKYVAVNTTHSDTLEVRIWRGCLNGLEYLSRIEMTHNIACYVKENREYLFDRVFGYSDLFDLNLYEILTYKEDNFTTAYLESKNFMTTVTTGKESII